MRRPVASPSPEYQQGSELIDKFVKKGQQLSKKELSLLANFLDKSPEAVMKQLEAARKMQKR